MTRLPIRPLDTSTLKPLFPLQPKVKKVKTPLEADRRMTRHIERRRFINLEQAGLAAEHIGRLPEPGELITSTMSGSFHGWALVPAILQLAQPATIKRLDISTLGYNAENSRQLFAMLDDGRIGSARMLASTYFKSVDPRIYRNLRDGLAARNQRLYILRVHAKCLLFEMTDGRTFTIESSANLRSCRNLEIFSLSADPKLHKFHQGWMTELVEKTIAEDRK